LSLIYREALFVMKKVIAVAVVMVLIVVCIFGFLALEKKKESRTNQEIISETELFDVSGKDVAIIYNFSLQQETGICVKDQAYLPIDWVNNYLNDKFFWDESINKLIYTMPTEILFFDEGEESRNEHPRFIKNGNKIYLQASFVDSNTSVMFEEFCGSDNAAKRVYINDNFDTYKMAAVKTPTMLRTGESALQRGIIELDEGMRVRIVKECESGWVRVVTETGYPGYAEADKLGDKEEVTPRNTYSLPVYSHLLMDDEVIMGWHQTTNAEANTKIEALLNGTHGLNVISPTWFCVTDNNGNISSNVSDEYISLCHGRGLAVWALCDNFTHEIDTTRMLRDYNARTNLITQLVDQVRMHGIEGINIDFEQLEEACGPYFVEFIRELSVSCRNNGIVLSVDNPNAQNFNLFYGRKAQAECADYVINMGYDEHFAGGDAGSVASITFVAEGINRSLEEVPANQLINAIPFYTRIWTVDGAGFTSQAVGMAAAQAWVDENNVVLQWNEDCGQYYGHSGDNYIWLEDTESLSLKIKLARDKKLAGIAGWKLGLEVPEVWDLF